MTNKCWFFYMHGVIIGYSFVEAVVGMKLLCLNHRSTNFSIGGGNELWIIDKGLL